MDTAYDFHSGHTAWHTILIMVLLVLITFAAIAWGANQ
jgi:preprotein translocase subunit SecE